MGNWAGGNKLPGPPYRKHSTLYDSSPIKKPTIYPFLGETSLSEGFRGEVRVPQFPAALPKRLRSFPFWRGKERFMDAMVNIYAHASIGGLNVVIGEKK
jgi:uncharacterized Zn finger protein